MEKRESFVRKASWGYFRASGGWRAVVWTQRGLSALVLSSENKAAAFRKLQETMPPMPPDFWARPPVPVPGNLSRQIRRSLQGKAFRFDRFDISFLTLFQQKILLAATKIPWGQTRSYGWVACEAGSPRGFRAAGQALNRNPITVLIPCHRVIASGGGLGGYGGGLDRKIWLLNNEGVRVKDGLVTGS